MAIKQRCPNCQEVHDISVYVSGQRLPCRRCGLKFEVVRNDVPLRGGASARGEAAKPEPVGVARPLPPPVDTQVARPAAPGGAQPRAEKVELAETVHSGVAVAKLKSGQRPAIPGFELIELVGRGGMGEVWRARQLSLGREVAVKTLATHLADEPDFVRRFEKEATALATLSHPNVVAIFDRGSFGGVYYLVMEFVTGPSLREHMTTGGQGPDWAIEVTLQLLSALDYAHPRGIVHRDLKPENILLAAGKLAKVADFGLAAILGRESSLQVTRPAVAMGTLAYMAPEQRKDAHSVDGRADLYSVAVILYEMLTHELPVGRFQLPSRRLPKIDKRIDDILDQALAPDPAARYQTAKELAAALAALDRGDGAPVGLRGWLKKLRSPT